MEPHLTEAMVRLLSDHISEKLGTDEPVRFRNNDGAGIDDVARDGNDTEGDG